MPAQQERVDPRELVDVRSRDPEWVRQQFEEIVALSFPPQEPPSGPRVLAGTVGPGPSGCGPVGAGHGRAPDEADAAVAGAGHGHRQRSPPGVRPRSRPDGSGVEEVVPRRELT